ncbi:hypothetical protein NE237_005756 [Protea cynaroides]|uniref:Rubisco accumulation factor 1 helix turn helix domain-containing protein n=1 Tax=Protea cynaroides TaxID=273540 RepID=A0A9Q0QUT1_9MAGN|nr:hypothetical protein NE237_005756 [Protea cynaroides]
MVKMKSKKEEALMAEFGSRQKSQWRSHKIADSFNKAKGALAQLENKEALATPPHPITKSTNPFAHLRLLFPSNSALSELTAVSGSSRTAWASGLRLEYAPLIPSLFEEGISPSSIEEATGISGVEQSHIVVAAKVGDSLVQSNFDPKAEQ